MDVQTGIITTVAGKSLEFGDSGDGGPATEALLAFPAAVTVAPSGDIYISDTFNYKVRRVDATSGIIETLAGIGFPRFSGDSGPASQAGLALTEGIAVDKAGNVYVSDSSNHRVRKISGCVTVTAPQLTTPTNGAQGVSSFPVLGWNEVVGAFAYDVYLDTVTPPRRIAVSDIKSSSFAPSNLEPLTAYYWKVVAKGDSYCEPFRMATSEVRSFTTASSCEPPGAAGEGGSSGND